MVILITLILLIALFCLILMVAALPLWAVVLIFPIENKSFGKAMQTSLLSGLAGLIPILIWPPLSWLTTFFVIRWSYKLKILETVIMTLTYWLISWFLIQGMQMVYHPNLPGLQHRIHSNSRPNLPPAFHPERSH